MIIQLQEYIEIIHHSRLGCTRCLTNVIALC